MKTVSAADANRQFSRLLRGVAQGESYTILNRGKPMATIAPISRSHAQHGAKKLLLARLKKQPVTGGCRWSRDELYEDPS